jgi:hypothetical protein
VNFSSGITNELTLAGRTSTIVKIRQAFIAKFMKTFLNPLKLSAVLGLLILAAGCATTKHTETFLTAAGFKLVVATTPKQEQRLKSLPPGKISMVQRNGKTYYVFPDAAHNQIYLGTPNEYQNYRQIVADSNIAAQDRVDAEMGAAGGDDWNDWDSWEVITIVPN